MNVNHINHVCFDLDGTLVDSSDTIYLATIEALNELRLSTSFSKEEFIGMIGRHFVDIFKELRINLPDFSDFISVYKSVYFDFIEFSNLYDSVYETIDYLINTDIKVSLLTTKAQDQAEKIIEYFDLMGKMHYIMGRRDGIAHKPSPVPLIKICNNLNIEPTESLMVGDTELDIRCGKNANAKTCGVLYGYRTKTQIENENPDMTISGLNELINLYSA